VFKKILIANRGEIACRVIRTARRMGIVAAAIGLAGAHAEAPPAQPITIGTSLTIASKPLGESRRVNVVLPASYAKATGKQFPVLYLIDGGVDQDLLNVAGVALNGGIWGRSADAIIVGIETKDRRRELVGPTGDPELLKKYPTAGSSAAFRAFIRDEVKPLIERNYRTSGQDAVIGESLAGLFIVETYMAEPALFDGYAAIDPSLWWDKEALSKLAATKIGARQKSRPLYIAIAKEQSEEPAAVSRVIAAVRADGARLCFNPRPDLTHATIYQQLSPQALQFLLPPAEAPPAAFGFEVSCSPKS
jgi:predicted alpha/beta superfamily hydrolase